MPHRPRTPCTVPGCPELVERAGKCRPHQREYDRQRRRRAAVWSDYGQAWRRIRLDVLAEQPLCRCGAPATEVDHIKPLRRGGTHDRTNLRAMCKRCHSSKTAGESLNR
jgi:5-methylcytosine-specific restriction protein A